MEPTFYPNAYYEAKDNFEADIDSIKDPFEISYNIFYGQVTNLATIDITDDLPKLIKDKIIQSFSKHFRSFQGDLYQIGSQT
jgi:hypothetical protein